MDTEEKVDEFWVELRKHTMWRDSESGIIEEYITRLLRQALERE